MDVDLVFGLGAPYSCGEVVGVGQVCWVESTLLSRRRHRRNAGARAELEDRPPRSPPLLMALSGHCSHQAQASTGTPAVYSRGFLNTNAGTATGNACL